MQSEIVLRAQRIKYLEMGQRTAAIDRLVLLTMCAKPLISLPQNDTSMNLILRQFNQIQSQPNVLLLTLLNIVAYRPVAGQKPRNGQRVQPSICSRRIKNTSS
jgi:hypothetical protein